MRSIACLFIPVFVACGGGDDASMDDGGGDATSDSPSPKPDSGKDATTDSKPADTGTDTGVDSGDDAAMDSGLDSGMDASDGSIVLDAGPPDASVMCGNKMGSGFQGMGQCGATEDYNCGNDKYEIACQCPAATCTCKMNGQTTKTLTNINGCPQCNFSFSSFAAQCGYPY